MMKNEWIQWLALLWLFLLTLINLCLIDYVQTLHAEQKMQKNILASQTEIIALNTVMLRAVVFTEQDAEEEFYLQENRP